MSVGDVAAVAGTPRIVPTATHQAAPSVTSRLRHESQATLRWVSTEVAAGLLGMSPEALRKAIDRRAVRAADGGIEASFDGVRARKLGRLWRVALGPAWTTAGDGVASSASRGARVPHGARAS